jgi:hypothetical protein
MERKAPNFAGLSDAEYCKSVKDEYGYTPGCERAYTIFPFSNPLTISSYAVSPISTKSKSMNIGTKGLTVGTGLGMNPVLD